MKNIKSKSIKYLKFNWDYQNIVIPGKYINEFKYVKKADNYNNRYEMMYLYIEINLYYYYLNHFRR